MNVYLFEGQPLLSYSQHNLFTLWWDLHLGQFDQAGFVIIPKLGQLVVHFLRPAQSAQQYHNIQFDHNNTLSHEALYAHFAWALMKLVKRTLADPKEFRILTASDIDGGMGGGGSGGDEGGSAGDEGDSAGDRGGSSGGDKGGGYGGGSGGNKMVTVVSNANAMMKTKMMNPIVVWVPPLVQAVVGEATTVLHLMFVNEKVEPDQYHAS